ncbi:MAG TPA: ferritin family protein [Methylocella sp.]|nr:ferritin family protein [Methylocella sp.]
MKNFAHLSEREILSLAIASEEDDNRVYLAFAEDLHERYPATAKLFVDMAEVEAGHFKMLTDEYRKRFGPNLVPIRRADVNFFIKRPPVWLTRNLPLKTIRKEAELREAEAAGFYTKAAAQATDPSVARLLGELAKTEHTHEELAATIENTVLTSTERSKEEKTSNRMFILQYVQPGLVGLMDGSVSTLAPLFAAAFATHNNWQTFLVGLAASLGAGISMGFAEALSDDGALSGRGSPVLRGGICGLMTAFGGLGHSLPYLIPNSVPNSFWLATGIAALIVTFELWIIAGVRARYMSTPFLRAVLQIVLGGAIVLATGILIGAA